MSLQLVGRVAVVTGGGTGLGKCIAQALAVQGATLVICSRQLPVLEHSARDLSKQTGATVVPIRADTTDFASLLQLGKTIASRFGRIDILVNCAASTAGLPSNELLDADIDMLKDDINTKTLGYLRASKALAPYLIKNGWGRIVNIGGFTALASDTLSGMRNVAISHLTKTLSDQLGPHGITVNQVHPGLVRTRHIEELLVQQARDKATTVAAIEQDWCKDVPIRRMLEPEEIANLVTYLCSPLAGGITGQSIAIDGGLTRGVYV